MKNNSGFSLERHLPNLLAKASVITNDPFFGLLRDRYGMLNSEWQVLYYLGRYGTLTAVKVCELSGMHKTKVSRAVKALETKRFLRRDVIETDKRSENLALTPRGERVLSELTQIAASYDKGLIDSLGQETYQSLLVALETLVQRAPRSGIT